VRSWNLAPAVGAALAAAAVASCTPRVPPPDLSLEPELLLGQVREAAAAVFSVRGEARLRASAPRRVSAAAFVAARRPDRLRIEVLDFFGNPAAVLATAGGRLAIWDARAGTFYRGAATPENVARLALLPLAPEELVGVLCGWPPLGGEAVRADPGRGDVTLEVRDGGRTTVARVVAGAAVSRATVRYPRGGYEVRWGVRAADAHAGPADLTLSSDRPKVAVELSWSEPEANAALDDALFELRQPRGARVVDLDEGGPLPETLLPGEERPGS
jgi:hypothetical protein